MFMSSCWCAACVRRAHPSQSPCRQYLRHWQLGAGATVPKKNDESLAGPNLKPDTSPSAVRRCPWQSWVVPLALFITFGGLFAFWIYMSLLGFTSDSWADMTTTWAFLVVWVLLAVATVAFPGTGEDDP